MNDKKVIIIGAGLAGLSAGCYARMNGFRSRIFEHHSAPGGVAAAWKRQGYLIDGGIHFMMGHKPGTALHRVLEDLGAGDPSLYADMLSYGRFIHQASGIDLTVGCDLDRLAAELKGLAPGDGAAIDRIVNGAKTFRGRNLTSFGMSRPPELASRLSQLRELWKMRSAMKYFSGPYGRKMTDFVKDFRTPWLKDFFCSLFLPESPPWFVMMILALVADRQCSFLARGCLDFVLAIERHYRELGGEVTYNSAVDRVLVENGRAVGIKVAGGAEHRADYVVSTGDSYHAIFNLLGGNFINDKIKKRHEAWPLSRPFLTVSYGVAREFPGNNPFTTIVLDKPVTIGSEKVGAIFVRILNYSSRFAPAGKTVLQVEIEAEFDYWRDLQSRDRHSYDREKERLAGEFLSRLEKYYPGLSSKVEMTDVATPYTTWRYTLNREGAWGAWLMTSDIMRERIERRLPGLENFFMAGQWVMCGGVPPSLYSGRQAIQLVCHDEGRKFVASAPGAFIGKRS